LAKFLLKWPEQGFDWHKKFAQLMVPKIMVDIARETQVVSILKASVSPENWISRRVVESEGLRKFGSLVHERRGLEEIGRDGSE
jgi:hypothetical protein